MKLKYTMHQIKQGNYNKHGKFSSDYVRLLNTDSFVLSDIIWSIRSFQWTFIKEKYSMNHCTYITPGWEL